MTNQELRDLVAANSHAIGRLETLQAQDREQLLLYLATIHDDVFDVLRPAGFEPRAFPN